VRFVVMYRPCVNPSHALRQPDADCRRFRYGRRVTVCGRALSDVDAQPHTNVFIARGLSSSSAKRRPSLQRPRALRTGSDVVLRQKNWTRCSRSPAWTHVDESSPVNWERVITRTDIQVAQRSRTQGSVSATDIYPTATFATSWRRLRLVLLLTRDLRE